MSAFFIENQDLIYIVVLSVLLGIEVISNVPAILHTPLMSGANAIHGIVLLGGIMVTGAATEPLEIGLGIVAILLGAINLVGGFVVTDRMLEMFKPRKPAADKSGGAA